MWNKDLKHMQEMSGESLGESVLAFVLMAVGTIGLWFFLAMWTI